MADIQSIPFANSPQHTGAINDNYIVGLQTGRLLDEAGLPQMKHITIGQLKNAVERTLSALFTFRGVYSEAVPEALAVNDYFYCNAQFTDEEQDIDNGTGTYSHTFYAARLYAYNGTVWADITPLLVQGVPAGGTTGQVLKKVSGTNYDTTWANEQDISGKADKAVPSAANNIALLSLIGNLVDSGISKDALQRVLSLIPAQADPTTNQLADKEFVNSSVATNTATFRGSYNLVSDLSLSTSATEAQIATAIATYLAGHSITADNNDYVFIQIPTSDSTPTEIREIDRYKFNGTAWSLEYPLNNSGFTAAQWAAINSNITAAKVTSYDSHLANNDLHVTAAQKTGWTNAIAGIQGSADAYDPDNESYAVGDPCIYNNVVYLAKEAITAPAGAFDAAKWDRSDLQTLMNGVKTNASAISDIIARVNPLSRYTRLTDFSLTDLQNAVADQNLAKYGLKVGDQKTINGRTYVIAGLNVMKGSHGYTCTSNHVGLIVIPHTTQKWNASGNTYTGADGRGAGYMNSDLHYYLKNTVLPMCNTDLGSSHLYQHNKLLSSGVNTTTNINRFAGKSGNEYIGASDNWDWEQTYISALSEMQVYGGTIWSSSGFDTGEADQQLPVFQEFKHTDIFGNEYSWLRDVASASFACFAYSRGYANYAPASHARYVAGLILYH